MGIGKNNKCTPTEYVVIYLKPGLFIFDKKRDIIKVHMSKNT